MSFRSLMVIKAVVCLLFGIGFIFDPARLFSIFGVTLGEAATFPAREYGAALFGNMVLTWYARDALVSTARTAIIRALFVYDAIGVVVSLMAVFSGILNALGWSVVVVYLFFTIGFGYYCIHATNTDDQSRNVGQAM